MFRNLDQSYFNAFLFNITHSLRWTVYSNFNGKYPTNTRVVFQDPVVTLLPNDQEVSCSFLVSDMEFLYDKNYSTGCTNWMFLGFIFPCPRSVLCFLRRRSLHSAEHRSGEILQLCSIEIHLLPPRDKWYEKKILNIKKKNSFITAFFIKYPI